MKNVFREKKKRKSTRRTITFVRDKQKFWWRESDGEKIDFYHTWTPFVVHDDGRYRRVPSRRSSIPNTRKMSPRRGSRAADGHRGFYFDHSRGRPHRLTEREREQREQPMRETRRRSRGAGKWRQWQMTIVVNDAAYSVQCRHECTASVS